MDQEVLVTSSRVRSLGVCECACCCVGSPANQRRVHHLQEQAARRGQDALCFRHFCKSPQALFFAGLAVGGKQPLQTHLPLQALLALQPTPTAHRGVGRRRFGPRRATEHRPHPKQWKVGTVGDHEVARRGGGVGTWCMATDRQGDPTALLGSESDKELARAARLMGSKWVNSVCIPGCLIGRALMPGRLFCASSLSNASWTARRHSRWRGRTMMTTRRTRIALGAETVRARFSDRARA